MTRIYVDMDGVISNFEKASNEFQRIHGKTNRPDKYVDYRNLEVVPGAKEAIMQLANEFDVFIATTPPWARPEVWGQKREWIEEHFPYLKRKLILTHRKDLLIGDILIDDTRYRGQPDFQGEWYWFNQNWPNRNWEACLKWIYKEFRK